MTDEERLSLLLDGELDASEEAALRERMAGDPALARRWEAMQQLPADLGALVAPVPPHLDEAVLGPPPPRLMFARYGPWLAAAAAILLLFLGSGGHPEAQVQILEGTQRLEGHVHALAGTVPVEVDGIAEITVEPRAGVAREWGRTEEPMPKTAILSALAGAAITVVVYEGRAVLQPDDAEPVVVQAGERHAIPAAEGTPGPTRVVRRVPADASPAEQVAHLEAENAALREKLAAAKFEGAIAKGQLSAHQGEPIAWPDDLPDGLEPAKFEAGLREVLQAHPDQELVALDCGEFPCVAVLTGPAGHDGWEDELQAAPRAFVEAQFPDDDLGMQMMLAATDDGETTTGAVGFALFPEGEDGPAIAGLDTRTGYRTRELLDGFVER